MRASIVRCSSACRRHFIVVVFIVLEGIVGAGEGRVAVFNGFEGDLRGRGGWRCSILLKGRGGGRHGSLLRRGVGGGGLRGARCFVEGIGDRVEGIGRGVGVGG